MGVATVWGAVERAFFSSEVLSHRGLCPYAANLRLGAHDHLHSKEDGDCKGLEVRHQNVCAPVMWFGGEAWGGGL